MALIKTVTNKFISKEDADLIKEAIEMTKVDRLFEQEKREAVEKAVNEAVSAAVSEVEARAEQKKIDAVNEAVARIEQEKADVVSKAEHEKAVTAQNFLKKGVSVENVAECTGLPIEKVQELAAAIA